VPKEILKNFTFFYENQIIYPLVTSVSSITKNIKGRKFLVHMMEA